MRVPEGWSKEKLCTVSKVIDSLHKTPKFSDDGLPMVRVADVNGGVLDFTEAVRVTDDVFEEFTKNYAPQKGDLIFSRVGSYGNCSYANDNSVFCLGQNIVVIKVNGGTDWKYTYYFLCSSELKRQIEKRVDGSSHKTVSLAVIRSLDILLPPLPEQKKIARILSTWDRAIEATEKLIENSKQQKKALMQQLLTGKWRLPGFEGEMTRFQIKNLAFVDQYSLSSKTSPNYKFRYISLSDVSTGLISETLESYKFDSAPSRARRIVKEGDIIMATVRPNLQAFTKINKDHADCIVSTGFAVISIKEGFDTDYLFQYLFSSHMTGQLNALVVGSSYPAINSKDVKRLAIYCPSLKEQRKISKVLGALDKAIQGYQKNLTILKQQKRALMQQLLTGKIRVQVDDADLDMPPVLPGEIKEKEVREHGKDCTRYVTP